MVAAAFEINCGPRPSGDHNRPRAMNAKGVFVKDGFEAADEFAGLSLNHPVRRSSTAIAGS
jgi:hypothetical protein